MPSTSVQDGVLAQSRSARHSVTEGELRSERSSQCFALLHFRPGELCSEQGCLRQCLRHFRPGRSPSSRSPRSSLAQSGSLHVIASHQVRAGSPCHRLSSEGRMHEALCGLRRAYALGTVWHPKGVCIRHCVASDGRTHEALCGIRRAYA